MLHMNLPDYVENLINLLSSAGEDAYAVGGCVRDMIMRREPNDFDMTTSAPPERTQSIFKSAGYRVIPTGIKHGTVTVMADSHPVEITTYRIDGDYRDSRHPNSVTFTRDVRDDLSRRDFTVNAMAYNHSRGLVDVFGGREDIEKCIIRCVGDPEKRFSEDALRILRAVRFSATLGFKIDTATLSAMATKRDGLLSVSRERIKIEFEKMLVCNRAGYAINIMKETGILSVIFPTLSQEYAVSLADNIGLLPPDFEARLAYLLSGSDGNVAKEVLSSLKLSSDSQKKALLLLDASKVALPCANDAYSIRKYLRRYGAISQTAAAICALCDGADAGDVIFALGEEAKKSPCLELSSLKISGSDLISLGITGGQCIGEVLSALLDAVLEDPGLNDREKLAALALKITGKGI